jgi:hypothetical protein
MADRAAIGFANPNHAAAVICALLPFCWGWRRYPWLWRFSACGNLLSLALHSLALSREFFAAVAAGAPCAMWGEDDTRQIKPCDRIDVEFRNPLYNSAIANLWCQ